MTKGKREGVKNDTSLSWSWPWEMSSEFSTLDRVVFTICCAFMAIALLGFVGLLIYGGFIA